MRVTRKLLNEAGYEVFLRLNALILGFPKRERFFSFVSANYLKILKFTFPEPCPQAVAFEDFFCRRILDLDELRWKERFGGP